MKHSLTGWKALGGAVFFLVATACGPADVGDAPDATEDALSTGEKEFLAQEEADLAEQAADPEAAQVAAAFAKEPAAEQSGPFSCQKRSPTYILHTYNGLTPMRCGSAPKWGYLHIMAKHPPFNQTHMTQTIGSWDSVYRNTRTFSDTFYKQYACDKSWYLCIFIAGASYVPMKVDGDAKGVLSAYLRVVPGKAQSCVHRHSERSQIDEDVSYNTWVANRCSTPVSVSADLPNAPDPACRTLKPGEFYFWNSFDKARGIKRCYEYGNKLYRSGRLQQENIPGCEGRDCEK